MLKILIAEDEPKMRRGLKKLILSFDLPPLLIEEATNGREALEKAKEQLPQMLIVDINMPFVNGLEFICQVKDILPQAFIVILTGYDNFHFAREALRLKVEDYLLKPVDEERLYELIQEANNKYLENHEKQQAHNRIKTPIISYIDNNYADPDISLEQISDHFKVSTSYIARLMKEELGISFIDYLTKLRIEAACNLLKEGDVGMKIYEIAEKVGYNSQHYFSRVFKKAVGITPFDYKKKMN